MTVPMKRFLFTSLAIALGLTIAIAMFLAGQNTSEPDNNQNETNNQAQKQTDRDGTADRSEPRSTQSGGAGGDESASQTAANDDRARTEQPDNQPADATDQSSAEQADNNQQPPAEAQPSETPKTAGGERRSFDQLTVVNEPGPDSRQTRPVLGADRGETPFKVKAEMTWYGGAIYKLTLADYKRGVHDDTPYLLSRPLGSLDQVPAYTYAAKAVTINDTTVRLDQTRWAYRTVEPPEDAPSNSQAGQYHLTIADGDDNPVLRIERTYVVKPGSYDIALRQHVENLTDTPLTVRFKQNIQGDLPQDRGAYLGDRRMYFTGYVNLGYGRSIVYGGESYISRSTLLEGGQLWPNPDLDHAENNYAPLWLASTNRYFAIATHRRLPAGAQGRAATAQVPLLTELFPRVGTHDIDGGPDGQALVFSLRSKPLQVAPDTERSLDLGIYAGPRKKEVFADASIAALKLDTLLVYELGCAWCTFQPLSDFLLWFLKLIEGQVLAIGGVAIGLYDWGVAIIVLVAVVRLLLHPLTKKGQVNMMKMSKQMQALQPEMEKLKKKYKDDQQKLNQEMMKLYREKGVNPAGFLGCAPMLLQMPIWVALYAMLYFAIELRHEPAFYGIFQQAGELFGVYWPFLGDLSRADRFIPLPGDGFTLPLIFIEPRFSAINILPILMAVVFYLQQKFTTPPATTEQAQQQQKMMRFMVLLFPIMLYSAPSGLTLYILASTAAGVVDSYLVRRHVNEQEKAGTLFQKKEPKPGGFRDRMRKALEQKQQEMMQQQQAAKSGKGGGKSGKGNGGASPGTKRVKSKSRKR